MCFYTPERDRHQTYLSVEASTNDRRRLAGGGASIALGSHDQTLQVDELSQMRLLFALGDVGAGRRDEEHIRHVRLLRGSDELNRDVVLVLVSRRNHADGVAARFGERLDHLTDATGLMGDDLRA